MNRRMLTIALLTLLAGAGAITVASLGPGCSESRCCKHGMMGDASHCSPKGNDPAPSVPTKPVAGNDVAKSGTKIVNARCPIMGGNPVAALTRDYNGQKIGFCCSGCPAQWDKLTDAEKDAKLAKAMAAGQ